MAPLKPILCLLLLATFGIPAWADTLGGHMVKLDVDHKIISWITSPSPYAKIVELAWNRFEQFPKDPKTGLKPYFTYPRFEGDGTDPTLQGVWWAHNPAGFTAMLIDSALTYYMFSGDHKAVELARELADYQLAHGTTPTEWAWSGVPFSSANPGELEWGGADDHLFCGDGHDSCGRGDGVGFLEPDKVGELGLGYLRLFEHTGERKYRDAALAAAQALVTHVRAGDRTHSPWPFRVDGKTGLQIREEYSSNVIGAVKFFDELTALGLGDTASYRKARKIAWEWMLAFPMQNHNWQAYFEDIPIFKNPDENPNQYSPLETIKYILFHPELDPNWQAHVADTLAWVRDVFGADVATSGGLEEGMQYGAEVMSEQGNDMAKMSSHTARYASTLALWYAKTGDKRVLARAALSFNWATYFCSAKGVVKVGPNEVEGYWFSDGYGDYMRHFLLGMATVPEWAPVRENHMLSASSTLRKIHYSRRKIVYSSYLSQGSEELKLASAPKKVLLGGRRLSRSANTPTAEGYSIEPLKGGGVLVRVVHKLAAHEKDGQVAIELSPVTHNVPPPEHPGRSGD